MLPSPVSLIDRGIYLLHIGDLSKAEIFVALDFVDRRILLPFIFVVTYFWLVALRHETII
jgi:hypothetical protein